MAFEYVKTWLRNSSDSAWYQERPEFLAMVQEKYIDTGKVLEFRTKKTLDSEQLLLEVTTVWAEKSYCDEFIHETMFLTDVQEMRDYNDLHGIKLLYQNQAIPV
jgi:hypothetical protein